MYVGHLTTHSPLDLDPIRNKTYMALCKGNHVVFSPNTRY